MDAVHRQEPDRQGRVSADRRDRGALRAHARRPLERARTSATCDRLLDDRIQRGGHARRPGDEVAVAGAATAAGQADGPAEPGLRARCRSAGRSSPATSTSSCASRRWARGADGLTPEQLLRARRREHHRCRSDAGRHLTPALRAGAGVAAALDELQAETGSDVPVHVDAASGGFRRAVPRAGTGVGLPARAGQVDQRLGSQVRPGAAGCGLGGVARREQICPRN